MKDAAKELESLIRKPFIKLTVPEGKNYSCPLCGLEPPDTSQRRYSVNNIKYPQYFNESRYFNGDINCHDWDELHCCKKCKREYYFNNGI